jgi:hypothetical protein
MFRRVYGSAGIPRAMWGRLHISNLAQANRMCPSLVPLGAITNPCVAGCSLGIPMAEALTTCSTAGTCGGDIAGSALDDLLAPGSSAVLSTLRSTARVAGCDVVSTVLAIRWCQGYEPMLGGTGSNTCSKPRELAPL